MRRLSIFVFFLGLSLGSVSTRAENSSQAHFRFFWLLNGTQEIYECEIPPTDLGTTTASCHDHDIINLRNDRRVGVATDASADVEVSGDGLVATGTTFFSLPQGDLTLRGTGTIQSVLTGAPIIDGHPVTHIAGIFPNAGDNMVLEGSGVFEGATGTFTLLGALDLSRPGLNSFHCVFEIKLTVDDIPENEELIETLRAFE